MPCTLTFAFFSPSLTRTAVTGLVLTSELYAAGFKLSDFDDAQTTPPLARIAYAKGVSELLLWHSLPCVLALLCFWALPPSLLKRTTFAASTCKRLDPVTEVDTSDAAAAAAASFAMPLLQVHAEADAPNDRPTETVSISVPLLGAGTSNSEAT